MANFRLPKREFICEPIEVECTGIPKQPVAFTWRGKVHQVRVIKGAWHDWGFGENPPSRRKWFQRRHRDYFHVELATGEVFEIYYDRKSKKNEWILLKRIS